MGDILLHPNSSLVTGYGATSEVELLGRVLGQESSLRAVKQDYGDGACTFYASRIDQRGLGGTWASRWLGPRSPSPTYPGGETGDLPLTRLEALMAAALCHSCAVNHLSPQQRIDTQLFVCTTKGNISLLALNPDDTRLLLPDLARRVAQVAGLRREPIVISNACISGVAGLIAAARYLTRNHLQHAMVLGGDELTDFVTSGFLSFRSVSAQPCRPYDAAHDGLSIGEAVACTLVSNTQSRRYSGSYIGGPPSGTPLRLLGGSLTNDANHISGPSRDGRPLALAIGRALNQACPGQQTDLDVAFVCPHGTGTVYSDTMEALAIQRARLSKWPVTSLKPALGHTLGAAGLLETLIVAQGLRQHVVPPTLGFQRVPEQCPPLRVSSQPESAPGHLIVKTASGFGGCNAALIVGDRGEADWSDTNKVPRPFRNVRIEPGLVSVDGQPWVQTPNASREVLLDEAYRHLYSPYDKWHKMDVLSRLAHIAFELLLRDQPNADKTALLLCGRRASMEADLKHQELLKKRLVKPATFVYTLPNIMIGEVCIRHKIQNESLYIARYRHDAGEELQLARSLLQLDRRQFLAVGWIDALYDDFLADVTLYQMKRSD